MFLRFFTIIFLLGWVSAKPVNLLSLNDDNSNGDTTDGVVYLYPDLRVMTLDPIITEPTKRDADSNVTASETSSVTHLSRLPLSISRDMEYPHKSISSEEDVDFPTDDYDIECDTEGMCWDHYDY
ncbi:hypothetical protein DAPPUDRAFT_253813 [Daphnia pulex]|uniref:Uncharacterized protein n=1 Tax=Daphnia pulex TaxID=6669 RepID=E9H5H0_DAPPU|nr:hypothetical protein DAPPUDRAFT_253813 [Daphnia pulex]|eukprot:EFX72957.1 hypothetical protein DAPPUDRAFT_253813 [Daphnia pulex]